MVVSDGLNTKFSWGSMPLDHPPRTLCAIVCTDNFVLRTPHQSVCMPCLLQSLDSTPQTLFECPINHAKFLCMYLYIIMLRSTTCCHTAAREDIYNRPTRKLKVQALFKCLTACKTFYAYVFLLYV